MGAQRLLARTCRSGLIHRVTAARSTRREGDALGGSIAYVAISLQETQMREIRLHHSSRFLFLTLFSLREDPSTRSFGNIVAAPMHLVVLYVTM